MQENRKTAGTDYSNYKHSPDSFPEFFMAISSNEEERHPFRPLRHSMTLRVPSHWPQHVLRRDVNSQQRNITVTYPATKPNVIITKQIRKCTYSGE